MNAAPEIETNIAPAAQNAAAAETTISRTSITAQLASKASLRKLMVSCIDSALEELGPIGDVSSAAAAVKPASPSKEDLYGYGPSSPAPATSPAAVELRDRRHRPRYQRRNSVTKFSISNALRQVQQEDQDGSLKESPQQSHQHRMMMLHMSKRMPIGGAAASATPSRQLWQHLYSKLGEQSMPLKRPVVSSTGTSAALSAVEMPPLKRRRGSAA